MQRNLRSKSQTGKRQFYSPTDRSPVFNKILGILFLSILLILLIYLDRSGWFDVSRPVEQDQPVKQTDLTQWQLNFEKVLAGHFMSIQWISNYKQFDTFSKSNSTEFTLRIAFPREYAIHQLIFDLINRSQKDHLSLIESYEKISPSSIQLSFTCPGGKILHLNFRENRELIWYSGKIAVIIDDFGYKMDGSVQQFLNLPFPITFAIIPGTPHAKQIAAQAQKSGFDVLIHLPMEPLNSQVENNGYTIFTRLSQNEITTIVKKAKEGLPHSIGVNNHMGSKATADRKTMARLMRALQKYNLLFLDSVTNRKSVAYGLAVQSGVRALKMTTYLDNPNDSKSIEGKLAQVVQDLKSTKTAIVIGHDRLDTARILSREMARWAFHGVTFVRLNDLLENPEKYNIFERTKF